MKNQTDNRKSKTEPTGSENRIWNDALVIVSGVLGVTFLLYSIFFLAGNSFAFEPIVNMLILILLVPALLFYFVARRKQGKPTWRSNVLMLAIVLNFLAVAVLFFGSILAIIMGGS